VKALIFPVLVAGKTASISNFDSPRRDHRDHMDANGKPARDGIGASIAQIAP
jgi:hypothetical protein